MSASAAKPTWQKFFDEGQLRRLARLAALREQESVLWLSPRPMLRATRALHRISGCATQTRASLAGCAERSLDLLVAPAVVQSSGFEAAFESLRPYLKTDGVLAVVGRAFTGAGLGEPLRQYWEERQPGPFLSVKATLARFALLGYEPLTAELLEEVALSPEERALGGRDSEVRGSEEGDDAPSARTVGTCVGLFVGRRVEPGSPPRWPRRGAVE